MSTEAARSTRRTRMTPERERELYEAVVELLREVGYDTLRMDAVAARTHSSKATLYRQWRGKPELVVAALRATRPVGVEEVDTGTLAGDLRELARQAADHAAKDAEVLRAVANAAERDPGLARALRESLVEPEIEYLRRMIDRAVQRGELPADVPARDFLPYLLLGPVVLRPLLENRPADAAFLTAYMDAVVLPALGVG